MELEHKERMLKMELEMKKNLKKSILFIVQTSGGSSYSFYFPRQQNFEYFLFLIHCRSGIHLDVRFGPVYRELSETFPRSSICPA